MKSEFLATNLRRNMEEKQKLTTRTESLCFSLLGKLLEFLSDSSKKSRNGDLVVLQLCQTG